MQWIARSGAKMSGLMMSVADVTMSGHLSRYLLGPGRVYAQALHQSQDLLVDVARLEAGLGTRPRN